MGVNKACRIWSQVVVSELNSPRDMKADKIYVLNEEFPRLEELKLKLRHCSARLQGRTIEAQITIELLALLEDRQGLMRFFSWQETLRDRLDQKEFSGRFEKQELKLIMDFLDINWSGELKGQEIHTHVSFSYLILATMPKVLSVLQEGLKNEVPDSTDDLSFLRELQLAIIQAEGEKSDLRRIIRSYESDIQSLKKGVSKAENRSQSLFREVNQYQQVIAQLRQALGEKEASLSRYQNQDPGSYKHPRLSLESMSREENVSFGSIIKRLFQTNL